MNIFFQGLPTAGKGTQTKLLTAQYPAMLMVDMGSLIRNDPEHYDLSSGQLLDSNITRRILLDYIGIRRDNIIFDGMPRRTEDLALLASLNIHPDIVFQLVLSVDEARARLQGRRIHMASGRTYNIYTQPPRIPDIDDITGEPLTMRTDDLEETLARRCQDYQAFWPKFFDFVHDPQRCAPGMPTPQWYNLAGNLDKEHLHQEIMQCLQAYQHLAAP